MRDLIERRFVLFGLVAGALGALFFVGWISQPATGGPGGAAAAPRAVPVTSAISSCPAPGPGRVAVFAAPGGQAGQGRAEVVGAPSMAIAAAGSGGSSAAASIGNGLGSSGSTSAAPLLTLSQPGRLWLSKNGFAVARKPRATGQVQTQSAAVIIEATGAMARGLEAEQTAYPPNGSAGTVSGVQCSRPGTDFWFLGPGPVQAAAINVHLVNPDGVPAAVDVEIFTDTGPLQGNADTGIEVPPRSSVVQSVSKLVPGAQVVALHVRTSVGRVVAAVQTAGVWWRPAAAPAAQMVIPGLPGTGPGRQLYLVDPGGSDAQVHVQAVTAAGTYEPAGAGGIDVPAGSVVAVDLPSLNGTPAALQLQSATPVTAALLAGDHAFTAATPPLQQQGVVSDNESADGYTTSVVLSAPAGGAQVRITTAGTGSASGAGQVVSIAPAHSANVMVSAPRGGRDGFAIVISPMAGSGPVYAGRVLQSRTGGVQLITPVVSAPFSVPLPAVNGSLMATIP